MYEPLDGALTQLWAGTSPEGADLNGKVLKVTSVFKRHH